MKEMLKIELQEGCLQKHKRTYSVRNGLMGSRYILVKGKWCPLGLPIEMHPQKRTRRNLGGVSDG